MKINMMSAQTRLTSACTGTTRCTGASERTGTTLPAFSGQAVVMGDRPVVLTGDTAARPRQERQEKSVLFQVQAGREAALLAVPAGAPAAPVAEADDYARQTEQTKHIGNGGLRGPQPWRHHPQVT
ncbi:hypothetical protein ACFOWE_08060 [Planomonospora corallina]|uniref:Uncharacterized protein n=1 Tax=Planomonospora corallina TaxID=1806052 RepID=A0ABV8I741_9ACTN